MAEAWVDWNPDPKVHAFGEVVNDRITVALCRTTVREQRGEFDPADPRACQRCAEYVRGGLTVVEAQQRVKETLHDVAIIECRR
jgi:hypothetical protein